MSGPVFREVCGAANHLGDLGKYERNYNQPAINTLLIEATNGLLHRLADLPPQVLNLLTQSVDNLHETLHSGSNLNGVSVLNFPVMATSDVPVSSVEDVACGPIHDSSLSVDTTAICDGCVRGSHESTEGEPCAKAVQ